MIELKNRIRSAIFEGGAVEEPLLLEDRHIVHFEKIRDSLERVANLLENNAPDEITAIEIDRALEHTGSITGRITEEEILDRIFSTFCIGK